MARRMTREGAKVKVGAELMPYSGGLKRNIVQCLDDFGIPLKLSHTVVDIKGTDRVEGVTIAQVDEKLKPIPGTEEFYSCDTLLLSCGLIPENELSSQAGVALSSVTGGPVVDESLETDIDGIFACGNVLHVHDLVDFVSQEASIAGEKAAEYVKGALAPSGKKISLQGVGGVRYTVPAEIDPERMADKQVVRFRVGKVFKNVKVVTTAGDQVLSSSKKRVMAPGEMEQVVIRKDKLIAAGPVEKIVIAVEDNQTEAKAADKEA